MHVYLLDLQSGEIISTGSLTVTIVEDKVNQQIFTITFSAKGFRPELDGCSYWIKLPGGMQSQVKLKLQKIQYKHVTRYWVIPKNPRWQGWKQLRITLM